MSMTCHVSEVQISRSQPNMRSITTKHYGGPKLDTDLLHPKN